MTCCLCGSTKDVIKYDISEHQFCTRCRDNYAWRGADALNKWLADMPPKHCDHDGGR